MWLLSISRNAIAVLICAILSYFWQKQHGSVPYKLSSHVPSGLPHVKLAPFSTTVGNETVTFHEMLGDLGSAVVTVPVVSVMANVAIAKYFGGYCIPGMKCPNTSNVFS